MQFKNTFSYLIETYNNSNDNKKFILNVFFILFPYSPAPNDLITFESLCCPSFNLPNVRFG